MSGFFGKISIVCVCVCLCVCCMRVRTVYVFCELVNVCAFVSVREWVLVYVCVYVRARLNWA